jgi:hypothetical protein
MSVVSAVPYLSRSWSKMWGSRWNRIASSFRSVAICTSGLVAAILNSRCRAMSAVPYLNRPWLSKNVCGGVAWIFADFQFFLAIYPHFPLTRPVHSWRLNRICVCVCIVDRTNIAVISWPAELVWTTMLSTSLHCWEDLANETGFVGNTELRVWHELFAKLAFLEYTETHHSTACTYTLCAQCN